MPFIADRLRQQLSAVDQRTFHCLNLSPADANFLNYDFQVRACNSNNRALQNRSIRICNDYNDPSPAQPSTLDLLSNLN